MPTKTERAISHTLPVNKRWAINKTASIHTNPVNHDNIIIPIDEASSEFSSRHLFVENQNIEVICKILLYF